MLFILGITACHASNSVPECHEKACYYVEYVETGMLCGDNNLSAIPVNVNRAVSHPMVRNRAVGHLNADRRSSR